MIQLLRRTLLAWTLPALGLSLLAPALAHAQAPSPHAIEVPPWFAQTFLDFKEDLADAGREGKKLLVYFGQDGCPYCRELMQTNFSQRPIVEKTRKHFTALEINIWGDREVTWIDGRRMSEKDFAREMKVQFTPTLLFMEPDGRVALRLNGYQPPGRFEATLDYVIQGRKEPLADYLKTAIKESGRASLTDQPFLMKAPLDLTRRAGGKPLALIFETRRCLACDEMHDQGFTRDTLKALLARFDVARLGLGDAVSVTAPDGRKVDAAAWARELKVEFTPAVVFFDDKGKEVFRFDGYTRPFHFQSAFDYVASGAYRKEPQFQRFVQQRAERLREHGKPVDLWR